MMIHELPDDRLVAPDWLDQLCPPTVPIDETSGTEVSHNPGNAVMRISATIPNALAMDAKQLEDAVAACYNRLFRLMRDSSHPHPLRIWNGLPGIVQCMAAPAAELRQWEQRAPEHEPYDRYMAFNAGRNTAFHDQFGGDDMLARCTPAASAVGHLGEHLQIHILASQSPGQAIENPRQTPAYHYSPRFGPSPPVFVRATRFGQRLMISGTASIVGEQSMHPDQLQAQFMETLANIQAITSTDAGQNHTLRHFRIYAPHAGDLPPLAEQLRQAHPAMTSLELMRADICRRNLRVEIEAAS